MSTAQGAFNEMMNSHFVGFEEIFSFPDSVQGRVVRVFFIGQRELVGLSNGSQAWVAAPSCFAGGKALPLVLARAALPRVKLTC